MQLLLTQHRDPNLRSYFVWGPFIRSDNEAAARENAQRFAAPNSMHFWTPTPKLERIFRLPSVSLPDVRPGMCFSFTKKEPFGIPRRLRRLTGSSNWKSFRETRTM